MYTTKNNKIHAALLLDPHSLRYQVEMTPSEALDFTGQLENYNDFYPESVAELLEKINDLIPAMQFAPNNPNNGRPHHTYRVGRESSRVLYLDIVKAYMPASDYAAIAHTLTAWGHKAKADEAWVEEDSESMFTFRFWWD